MKEKNTTITKRTFVKYMICAGMISSILVGSHALLDARAATFTGYAIVPNEKLDLIPSYIPDIKTVYAKYLKESVNEKQEDKAIKQDKQEVTTTKADEETSLATQDSAIIDVNEQSNIIEQSTTQQPTKVLTQTTKQETAESPEPVQQENVHPIAQRALSLVGQSLWCEEVAEQSIEVVGKSAWLTRTYEEGDILVEETSMGPDNFLQIATRISLSQLEPGDLLYYANNGSGISHIAVYVGNEQAVHGGYGGRNVVLTSMYLSGASTPIGLRV